MVGGGKQNVDVADILFLHLARLGPELITSGDKGFVPSSRDTGPAVIP
jgi:hypothetical protein